MSDDSELQREQRIRAERARMGAGPTGGDSQLRAADGDRKIVADRLRHALDEGRITLGEYDERIATAYQAITYADLNRLLADLPTQGGVLQIRPMADAPAEPAKPARKRKKRRFPLAIQILWTIWGGIVGVNFVVWAMVSLGSSTPVYPWWIWVAGPSGALLLAATVGVQIIRAQNPD